MYFPIIIFIKVTIKIDMYVIEVKINNKIRHEFYRSRIELDKYFLDACLNFRHVFFMPIIL